MNTENESCLHSLEEDFGASSASGQSTSDPDMNINQRMAQFLLLLQQIEESAGLAELPDAELSEMVTSALGLCGFVDSNDARDVIASVLAAIERGGPIAGDPISGQPISGEPPPNSLQVRHNWSEPSLPGATKHHSVS